MLTYVVVILVVIGVLYGSFRALGGGGEPIAVDDYRTVLSRLSEFTATRADELRVALDEPLPAATEEARGGRAASDPMSEAAGAARKKLGAYLQQLARLDVAASEAELVPLTATRSLLEAAIEDLGWACRMVEAGVYRDNPGIQRAVALLREQGEDYLAQARGIVDQPHVAGPEPGM